MLIHNSKKPQTSRNRNIFIASFSCCSRPLFWFIRRWNLIVVVHIIIVYRLLDKRHYIVCIVNCDLFCEKWRISFHLLHSEFGCEFIYANHRPQTAKPRTQNAIKRLAVNTTSTFYRKTNQMNGTFEHFKYDNTTSSVIWIAVRPTQTRKHHQRLQQRWRWAMRITRVSNKNQRFVRG